MIGHFIATLYTTDYVNDYQIGSSISFQSSAVSCTYPEVFLFFILFLFYFYFILFIYFSLSKKSTLIPNIYKVSNFQGTSCVCDVGYWRNNDGLCNPCEQKTFKSTIGDFPCTSCPKNTYSNGVSCLCVETAFELSGACYCKVFSEITFLNLFILINLCLPRQGMIQQQNVVKHVDLELFQLMEVFAVKNVKVMLFLVKMVYLK